MQWKFLDQVKNNIVDQMILNGFKNVNLLI